ncbi:MAG TPA: DUF2147 domain-containing protein [Deltaproteobacteria bacterium]|nr:DUF2147 domain-containing protein [Deltaproteobacteria bacterium]
MKKVLFSSIVTGLFMFLVLCPVGNAGATEPVEGFWTSIDEETNESTAFWELTVRDGELTGTIVKLPEGKDPDAVCEDCSEEYKDKPVIGTTWLHLNKRNDDGVWEDGFIIDSGKGKQYKAKVWTEEGDLKVRGYIGFFYRTQTWKRVDDPR